MTDIQNAPAVEQVAVTQADEDAANALDDALGFLTDLERPIVAQAFARHRLAHSHPAATGSVRVELPADIAEHVTKIGRVEWGQTPAHDAEGHGRHVADSVRLTAAHFGQTGDQHMHGLWLEGTETVLCHTGTSPNAPKTTQALVGAWNWLVDQAATPTQPEATGNDGAGQEATLEMRQAALDASRQSEPPFLPVGRELWAAQECWSVMFAAQTADAHTPTREG
jgi:hypothetical protein